MRTDPQDEQVIRLEANALAARIIDTIPEAMGMTPEDIVADYPELTRDDVMACLAYAADREKHAVWVRAAA